MYELIGSIEDIDVSEISPSEYAVRSIVERVDELARSIQRLGLLQPIIVRANKVSFEIIAGNRRFRACKMLGLKKVSCHIVELDDKSAFEVSLVENVQRNTLNPIEEGLAFRKYVHEFGWGGISELGQKICKSPSYISRRIKLVNLPQNILDLISQSSIDITTVEELLPVEDNHTKSVLTELIRDENLSSRAVRQLVKNINTKDIDKDSIFIQLDSSNEYTRLCKSFDKAIIALRIAIKKLATMIEKIEDNWLFYDMMMQHKHLLHSQVDLLIKQKSKYKKHFLRLQATG
ncbi:MAG TPA: ParB/RepB/Spo0J family partition protein [Nitrososphaeraceae archaeon]